MSYHRHPRPKGRPTVTEPTSSAPVDRRLHTGVVTNPVLQHVLADHDCSGSACSTCGFVPTRTQPVCRSAEIARAALWGQKVRTPRTPRTDSTSTNQLDMFTASTHQIGVQS